MKQIYSVLLLLLFVYWNKANGQSTISDLQASVNAGIDPYFIETTDTISTRGPISIVRSLLQDKNGNFWFATWQGIMKYDGKLFTNYTLKEGLIHFHVFSVFEDKAGNIWFGTVRGGLYRYDPSASLKAGGKSFTLFTTKDGLTDNTARGMLEDKAGNIWFACGGVTRYDPSASLRAGGKTFTNFTTKDGLCSDDINAIIQDKTGKLWFGGRDGISYYDPSDSVRAGGKSFTNFKNKDGLPFEGVASLLEDKAGNIWIGSRKGLCRFDGSRANHSCNTKSCKHDLRIQQDLKEHDQELAKSLSDFVIPNFVMYMCEDKKGNLWLAHNTYPINNNFVLYRYDGKSFAKTIEEPYSGAIFGIIEDKSGNIWFGTGLGVCRFDVLQADNPCIKKTCKHDLPYQQATKEHNKELARSFTYFTD